MCPLHVQRPVLFLFIFYLISSALMASGAPRKDGTIRMIKMGYVGKQWRRPLQWEISRRKLANIKLGEVKVELKPRNLYSSILEVDNYIQNNSHDIIIGDHSLSLMSVTGTYNMPYFDLDINGTIYDRSLRPRTVFSFPIPDDFYARAIVLVLMRYRVDKVAILIDETADYKGFLEPFFKQTEFYAKVWTVHKRRDPLNMAKGIQMILRNLRRQEYRNIIVKASVNNIQTIIGVANYLAMVASPNCWFFPSVVCDDFGYTDLAHIKTNFTFINDYCNADADTMSDDVLFWRNVLLIQAFDLLEKADWSTDPTKLRQVAKLPFGSNPYMSSPQFNDNGMRTNVTLQLHIPNEKKVVKAGYAHFDAATAQEVLWFVPPFDKNVTKRRSIIRGRQLTVIGVVEHPHLIREKNGTYVGFGVDILDYLSNALNFTYRIEIADHYGNLVNNEWTGVMRDLLQGRADMTLGPLVQSGEREDVIDFSTTFKQREISIVMRRPQKEPSFFQFARPFDIHVWGCVIASIIFMSFTLWLVEIGSAKANRRPTDFDLRESAWYIFATTVQGGTEAIPRSLPGRILSGTLYFFVLILTTSYTANLAAFLTVQSFNVPISKVEDLPNQQKIKYGTVWESGVLDFFQDSKIPAYRNVFRMMHDENPSWMVNSSEDGFKRARTENYAFIWDDSVNEYEVNIEDKKCELMVVGRAFGKRSFAIGLPQGSRYKEDIDRAILKLIDSTELTNLEHKWWRANSPCKNIGSSSGVASQSLSVFDVAGVLLVLFCGCALSLVALLCETFVVRVLCRSRSSSKDRGSRMGSPSSAEQDLMLTPQSLQAGASNGPDSSLGDGGGMLSPPMNANNVREFAL